MAGPDQGGATGSGGVVAMMNPNLTPSGNPRCGVLDPARADDCAGIELITLMDPRASSNVDGSIQVGESEPFDVWVKNGDQVEHDNVCVGVVVDTPGITLTGRNPQKAGQMRPDGVFIITPADISVGKVEPGTTAHFTAWTTYEGTNCLGPTATVDALVKAYR